jgi:hypothetical protein
MKDNFFVKNKSIITFLILEVVALTTFNFGNNSAIFGIVGGALALIALPFVYISEENRKSIVALIIPILMLLFVGIMGAVNGFSQYFEPYVNVALAVSLPGFLALGFFLRKLNDVKPKTVLLVVGGALAAICLFGLLSTVIEYGLFYSLIYKKTPNYYYNGTPFDVTKEMFWLNGFEFNEVYIEYGSLFAVLASCFLVGLLFLSPKKDRNEFISCSVIGGIGLLTLLVLPNFKAIIIVLIASVFAFVIRFLPIHKRVQKIIGFSFLGVVGLGLVFFVVAIINAATGFKFLPRVFVNNGIMSKTATILKVLFANNIDGTSNLFGIYPYELGDGVPIFENSGIFEIELLKEVGLLGAVVFIGFVIYAGYFIFKYFKNSKDNVPTKSIFIVMLLAFFIYESIFHTIFVTVHSDSYYAFLKSPLLLFVLFVIGYLISDIDKKGGKSK